MRTTFKNTPLTEKQTAFLKKIYPLSKFIYPYTIYRILIENVLHQKHYSSDDRYSLRDLTLDYKKCINEKTKKNYIVYAENEIHSIYDNYNDALSIYEYLERNKYDQLDIRVKHIL